MTNQYDEDYFIRGKESGKSLYENYRWMPGLTIPMAKTIVEHCGISKQDRILDFGCARGYVVKALVANGHDAFGVDVSEWAIKNSDEDIRWRLNLISDVLKYRLTPMEWVIAKDVLEHVPQLEIKATLAGIGAAALKGVFIVVPLSPEPDTKYVVPEYEKDVTHVIRWPLWRWVKECIACFGPEFEVSGRYRIKGVKDNYSEWGMGNGFITAKRI